MTKKSFSEAPKPTPHPTDEHITAFERDGPGQDTRRSRRNTPAEPVHRLSLDIPKSLHQRFKLACTTMDNSMTGEIQRLIEARTGEIEKQAAGTE